MSLSASLLVALENLGRKKAGHEVDWISIGDARTLTDLGLAARTGSGWTITAAGTAALDAQHAGEPGAPAPEKRR
jgi:hypothetical protein